MRAEPLHDSEDVSDDAPADEAQAEAVQPDAVVEDPVEEEPEGPSPLEEAAARPLSAPDDLSGVLRDIARPRLTGSMGAAETAIVLRRFFEDAGYDVDERPFRFNPLPGRFGLTAVGVVYALCITGATLFMIYEQPVGALIVLVVLALLVGAIALGVPKLIDSLGWRSIEGSNLWAAPKSGRPRWVIMAHRDSKSQPLSLAFRGPAIVTALVVWVGLVAAAAALLIEPVPGMLLGALLVAGLLAGLILAFCWVDDRSPGALDNASGVAAAIAIAARERDRGDVAFLITDAEELGLAGARAAAGTLPPVFGVINIDSVDDHGTFYICERFGTVKKQGLAPHLAAPLLQQAEKMDTPADRRDLPFAIPVDHIPIVKGGVPALTIMRGSTKSLRRVHQPGDDLNHLSGDGVRLTVDLVCGALQRMREQAAPAE